MKRMKNIKKGIYAAALLMGCLCALSSCESKKKENKNIIQPEEIDEEMTVTMELEDGESVTCAIITILTVNEKDYIILLPLDEKGENEDGEVWIYGYKEDESDPNAEPELFFIEDEDEYDAVSDAFDEYLDQVEFDELIDESSKGSK